MDAREDTSAPGQKLARIRESLLKRSTWRIVARLMGVRIDGLKDSEPAGINLAEWEWAGWSPDICPWPPAIFNYGHAEYGDEVRKRKLVARKNAADREREREVLRNLEEWIMERVGRVEGVVKGVEVEVEKV